MDRRNLQLEPSEHSLRKENRREIQSNLTQPGFHFSSPTVIDPNHKSWWNVLEANRYTFRHASRIAVAQKLIELYESCLAEVEDSPNHQDEVAERARIWNPGPFEKIHRRLMNGSRAWRLLSEHEDKRDLSYGISVFARGRKEFVSHPTKLPRFGRREEQLYQRLWVLVDGWIQLTIDCGTDSVPGNPTVAADIGSPGVPVPANTAVQLLKDRSLSVRRVRFLKVDDEYDDDDNLATPLTNKLTSGSENTIAEENLQMTKRSKESDTEQQHVRTDVDAAHDLNKARLGSYPTKTDLSGRSIT